MFGSHLSIAGGMYKALLEAERLGLDTVQVFTANQQQWSARGPEAEGVALWHEHRRRLGFDQVVSHDSYLINLASPDESTWRRSIDAFEAEVRRCVELGIGLLVAHPGSHMGSGEAAGLERVAEALDEIHRRVRTRAVVTCLEATAGMGSSLGWRMEHLAAIRRRVRARARVGYCLDTAHLFAAGYDFRGRRYAAFMREVEAVLGAENVRVLHLNDSKRELGSRVDRHEHIGRGQIGQEGFAGFIRDARWRNVPKILETPKAKSPDGRDWDTVNLETLRGLGGAKRPDSPGGRSSRSR